jgi:hypothetical protein
MTWQERFSPSGKHAIEHAILEANIKPQPPAILLPNSSSIFKLFPGQCCLFRSADVVGVGVLMMFVLGLRCARLQLRGWSTQKTMSQIFDWHPHLTLRVVRTRIDIITMAEMLVRNPFSGIDGEMGFTRAYLATYGFIRPP